MYTHTKTNTMDFKKSVFKYFPTELVDLIADYHDYDKHCKPNHKEKYVNVLNDINYMGQVIIPVSPSIAKQCWGSQSHLLPTIDWNNEEGVVIIYDNENMVGLNDVELFDDDDLWEDPVDGM